MNRIFILHLLPLEFYPPVTNLLAILDKDKEVIAEVYSSYNNKNRVPFKAINIPIIRTEYPGNTENILLKLWHFFKFIIKPFLRLLLFRPDVIFYYEPHSAMPVYFYKKFIRRKVRIFIHYHEYYSKSDFNGPSMASVRLFHKFEVSFLYDKAEWISQTNNDRLSFFSKDYPFVSKSKFHILANYPPKSWSQAIKVQAVDGKIRMIYLGALSFENTYIKEIITFVTLNPDRLSLDIYSFNFHDDLKVWLKTIKVPNIIFNEQGVAYEDIPKISRNYDVGLVLYKGHNTNYQFNAPNKLFEYLVCGLDVWVPQELKGCEPYLNEELRPYVISIDYKNLTDSALLLYSNGNEKLHRTIPFNSEDELGGLIKKVKRLN